MFADIPIERGDLGGGRAIRLVGQHALALDERLDERDPAGGSNLTFESHRRAATVQVTASNVRII